MESRITARNSSTYAALQAQLALLDHAIEAIYILPEELDLARATDSQGLGGTPICEKQPVSSGGLSVFVMSFRKCPFLAQS
jgi:hypothetical protein